MDERLEAVITANKAVQQRARELNVRAGQSVFPVMSQSEWEKWLMERLQGAVSVATTPDFDALRLPALDEEVIGLILQENPDVITIFSQELLVRYESGRAPRVTLEHDAVMERYMTHSLPENILLPGGRAVELFADSQVAANFPELVVKLEKARIERAWQERRRELEFTSWIKNPQEVFPHLSKLLSEVEITRTENGMGEPIVGIFSLYSDSDPDFQIRIRESREEVEKETKIGLERLVKKSLGEVLIVPQEEPFQTRSSGYYSSWNLTELGQALKTRLEKLATNVENLNPSNVLERVEEIRQDALAIRAEVGGRYTQVRDAIAQAEQKLEALFNVMDYNDRQFVSAEKAEAEKAVKDAKEKLKSLAYDDAAASCQMAEMFLAEVPALVEKRREAREEAQAAKERVAPSIYNLQYGYDDFNGRTEEERARAREFDQTIDSAYDNYQYDIVLTKVVEAEEFVFQVKERLERFIVANARLLNYAKEQFGRLPVLEGIDLEGIRAFGDYGYLPWDHKLFEEIKSEFQEKEIDTLLIAEIRLAGGSTIAWLEVEKYDRNEHNFSFRRDSEKVHNLADEDFARLSVVVLWSPPSDEILELESKIRQAKSRLESIEREGTRAGRVEITFRLGSNPKGEPQLEADGIFTGTVENRKDESGYSSYENQQSFFVSRISCPWLDENYQPQDGQTWVCTTKFQIGAKRGLPIIVVNPQVRVDADEIARLESEIEALEKELETARNSCGPVLRGEELVDATAMLRSKFGK